MQLLLPVSSPVEASTILEQQMAVPSSSVSMSEDASASTGQQQQSAKIAQHRHSQEAADHRIDQGLLAQLPMRPVKMYQVGSSSQVCWEMVAQHLQAHGHFLCGHVEVVHATACCLALRVCQVRLQLVHVPKLLRTALQGSMWDCCRSNRRLLVYALSTR